MNTRKKLAPPAKPCTLRTFEAAISGYDLYVVSDKLSLMLGLWNALSPREYWIWSQLMVRVKELGNFNIRITHKTLCEYLSVSEATIRGTLNRLSTLGFVEIVKKTITRSGKSYVLRPSIPKHLLPKLKVQLAQCRKHNPGHKKLTYRKNN